MANVESKNTKKFEVLIYLELTCAALEECFDLMVEGKYEVNVKKRIDSELKAFESCIFKKNSIELSNTGKYATAIIGRYLFREKTDAMVKKGLAHILENIEPLKNVSDYNSLKRESLKSLSGFFKTLIKIYAEQADRISF